MKNQLSLFNIRLPLLLGASLFLLSCASTDSTTTVSNEISPPVQTEVLSEEWIENDKATNFLPLSRQFKHSTKNQTANWVQIKHSKGTYPAIDSLKMPLENFFKTKFTSVDESQTTKSQFIDREALIFSLTGKKEGQSLNLKAALVLGKSKFHLFYIEGQQSKSALDIELKDFSRSFISEIAYFVPPTAGEDNLASLGLNLEISKAWKPINPNHFPLPSQRFVYELNEGQCYYTITGAYHQNKTFQKNQLLDSYLASLGTSVDDENQKFSRTKRNKAVLFKLDGKSTLEGYQSKIEVSVGLDRTYMTSMHCQSKTPDLPKLSEVRPTEALGFANDAQEAFIINQVGLMELVNKRNLVALSLFDAAQKLDPTKANYLANCGYVYQVRELFGPGILHFQKHLDLVKQNGLLLKIMGEFYENSKEYSNAYALNKAAFEYMPFNEELAINISDALWGMGRKTESYRAVNELYKFQESHRLGLYLAKTLLGLEFYQNGATLLSELREKYPLNKETAKFSMIAHLFLQEYEEALAMAQLLEKNEKLDLELLILKGKSEFYLKRFKEALVTFKKAKRIRDNHEEVQSFLAATKSFLGIGKSKVLSRRINPTFKLGKPFANVNKDFARSLLPETYPSIMHHRHEELYYSKEKPWTITEEIVVQILDEQGLSAFQEFNFSFIPGYDRVYVNHLNVYDSTQNLRFKGNPKTYYVSSDYGANANSDVQLAHIPIRKLQVGDYIHLQWSRQSIDKSSFVPFMHHMFNRTIPTGKDVLVLKGDLSQIQTEVYGELEDKRDLKELRFELVKPSIIRKELYSPHYRDIGTGVLVSHKRDWTSVGAEYEKLIKHQMKSSIDVEERAYLIRGNLVKTEKIIEKMIRWVRKSITYDHILFGDRTIIPVTAKTTLKNRKGDCKDQSLLLKQLLGALNIPSELTLVHLSTPVSPALPSLQQFDHMILHIPAGKDYPERFVDLTEHGGSNRIIPYHLENKYALLVNGEKSKLVITPTVDNSNEHRAHFEHTVALDEKGGLNLKDSLVLGGKFGVAFREKLWNLSEKEQIHLLENWLSHDLPEVNVQTVKTQNLNDHDKSLIIVVYYQLPHLFYRNENDWIGDFPNIWERAFMNLPRMRKRHHPIRLPHEMHFTSVLNWKTIPGQEVVIREDPINPDRYYTELKQNSQKVGDKTTLTTNWITYATYTEAEEYEKLRDEWQEIIDQTLFKVKVKE